MGVFDRFHVAAGQTDYTDSDVAIGGCVQLRNQDCLNFTTHEVIHNVRRQGRASLASLSRRFHVRVSVVRIFWYQVGAPFNSRDGIRPRVPGHDLRLTQRMPGQNELHLLVVVATGDGVRVMSFGSPVIDKATVGRHMSRQARISFVLGEFVEGPP